MAAHSARLNVVDGFADRDRRELHRLLAEAFDDAATLAGATHATVRLGRERVRIRTAGEGLAEPLLRALNHLRTDPTTTPTATIDSWDSASTGRPLPLLVAHLMRLLDRTWLEDRDVRGELRSFSDGPVRAAYYGPKLLSVYDVERRSGIFWLQDAAALPWYEAGAPFRALVDWIVAGPTRQMIHAGAIAGPTGAVVLGGAGGTGKSTTALACLGHPGLRYMSDDYVIVEVEPEPLVTSVYATAKLKSLSEFDRFEHLRASVVNRERATGDSDGDPDAEKPMLFVNETAPECLVEEMPLRALVFPRFVDRDDCTIARLSSDVAFKLLAPSTLQQVPATGGAALRCMRTLAGQVPAFGLGLPRDPRKIPDALVAILAEVS